MNLETLRAPTRLLKHFFDLSLGLLLLLLLSPLLLFLILAVRLDSPGPALHVQTRIGRQGREFPLYKFRTMYREAGALLEEHLAANPAARQEWEDFKKLRNGDPRITRTGRLLRRFSLDELPQLANVLTGQMSLVGPRPYLPDELELLGEQAPVILSVKPGLTGLWQVSGRNNLSIHRRVQLDTWYVHNWSIRLDLVLLLKTLVAAVTGEGAY